jgi:hypothetical protein
MTKAWILAISIAGSIVDGRQYERLGERRSWTQVLGEYGVRAWTPEGACCSARLLVVPPLLSTIVSH